MPSAFEIASAVDLIPGRENVYRAVVPDGWQQGRGAFGGLVLATLLRAIEKSEPDPRRTTRTLLGDICGPVQVGDCEITVDVLRRGANQSNLRADLRQGGEIIAFASAVMSTPRTVALPDFRPRVHDLPDVGSMIKLPAAAPGKPTFTQHWDMHTSTLPWSGAKVPEVIGYVRETQDPAAIDGPMLIALLDSFWPSFFSVADAPRPVGTVSFAAEILCDPTKLAPNTLFHYRSHPVVDHEGFQLELRELYGPDGNLIAANQQTIAIIK